MGGEGFYPAGEEKHGSFAHSANIYIEHQLLQLNENINCNHEVRETILRQKGKGNLGAWWCCTTLTLLFSLPTIGLLLLFV